MELQKNILRIAKILPYSDKEIGILQDFFLDWCELNSKELTKKVWGTYFDDIDEDCNASRGELSQKDFLAGYNQALEDNKFNEMREMIKALTSYVYRNEKFPEKFNLWLEATNLIKEIENI